MEFPIHHFRRAEVSSKRLPDPIWTTAEPPSELFIQGTDEALTLFQRLPERGLAIVGTRNPQPRSVALLRKWILELKNSHLIIISGLARGIDTIAHTTALEAGLPTVAVLGAGLNISYPRENQELRKRILKSNGLIVSEFPMNMPALGHHFLSRNRLIAGWSKATWVVEAGRPSGAISTARWARDRDQTCFAVPCFPGDPAFAGNQTLLDRDHALAFWGIHSLGAVWIDLATFSQKQLSLFPQKGKKPNRFELLLLQQVIHLTHQKGGADVHELLDWALAQDWSPQQYFSILQSAIQQKLIIDQHGTLVSI